MGQKFRFLKITLKEALFLMGIAVFTIIGTFPENDWSFSSGVDSPLLWVFNSLFANGLNAGRRIIFPHGPLAFFMYPLSENIVPATLVTAVLKILLVLNFFVLLKGVKQIFRLLLVLLFSYAVSVVSGFNQLLLSNVFLLYCNYYENPLVAIKLTAFLLTAFAFYVKAYVAILTGALFVAFVGWQAVTTRNWKNLTFNLAALPALMLLFWLIMFGTLAGFLHYVWGMLHLAQDNSAAAALYPYNNWWWIILSMMLMVVLLLVNRSSKTLYFSLLFIISLFAAWKHGMAREDVYHVKGLITYFAIGLALFIPFIRKKWFVNLALSVAAVVFLVFNLKNSINYHPLQYEFFSGKYFVAFVTGFNTLKEEANQKTAANLVPQQLPEQMLNAIGQSTVDIYPWDYSIAAMNNLNWKPRAVIQSYAAYTSWLDAQDAGCFSSEEAPQFVVWEKEKGTVDINGGTFNSIDYRYLLNDEPQAMLELLRCYKPVNSEGKFLLLKKREVPLSYKAETVGTETAKWDEWIEVPEFDTDLLRARLNFSKSLKQQVKSFLYKDEQCWVYLKLVNGSVHKYRIVPQNASDGLWINPYLFRSDKTYKVEQILFKTSGQGNYSTVLDLSWEAFSFIGSPHLPTSFFSTGNLPDPVLFESINNFDENVSAEWSPLAGDQKSRNVFSGSGSQSLKNSTNSCIFSIPLDSIPYGQIRIEGDAWVICPDYQRSNSVSLVLEVNDGNGQNLSKSQNIDEQFIDEKGWNHMFNYIEINHNKPGCTLKAYFWNRGDKNVTIDDFRVRILKQGP